MKDNIKNKNTRALEITIASLTEQVQSNHSDRYDQMIISGEIERNDVYYINYAARYVTVEPRKVVFAMVDDVKFAFESFFVGDMEDSGTVRVLDTAMLREIKNSKAVIAEKSFGKESEINDVTSNSSLLYLKEGFVGSKEAKEQLSEENEEDKSFLSSFKKAMNEPIVSSNDDDDDDDDDDDFFETINWFDSGISDSNEYQNLKISVFPNIQYTVESGKPSFNQPLYFVPSQTKSENCKACQGNGEITCPTCKGTGKIKCKGQVLPNKNAGPVSNIHYRCVKGMLTNGDVCGNCGGPRQGAGLVNCERKNGSKYGIGKLADMATGKPYCGGKGKVDCKPCKATGKIGTLLYLKVDVNQVKGEFFKFSNQQIDQIKKTPKVLYPFLDISEVKRQSVYLDDNESLKVELDEYSKEFIEILNTNYGLNKGNSYPRILHEEIYYDLIPLVSIEYNHILTATNHLLSGIPTIGGVEVLFHTDPTAVKKFSLKNIWKIYSSKWSEAFLTQSYKSRRDKYNEIRLLIYIAKADGKIADEEKQVLANSISGLSEYTASQKSKLFGLMSSKNLPPLEDEDFVFSTQERADLTISRLKEMALEDGSDKEESQLVNEYKEKINLNIGAYPKRFKQFIKTWQVSLTVLLMIISLVYYLIFTIYIKPRKLAFELHQKNLQKEEILTAFVNWTKEDTINNLDFNIFIMDRSINAETDYESIEFQDELEKYRSAKYLLSSINHNSDYQLDGEKITYAEYWKKEKDILSPKIDFLTNQLILRKARKEKENKHENDQSNTSNEPTTTLSIEELSPDERVEGVQVSNPDGFYLIDDREYTVENGIIILVSGLSDLPGDASGEEEGDY